MKNEKYTAGGYLFEDEESLKEARNELEGVEYLKKRTNYKNPKSILNIYNTVIEKKLFKTPVGYEFLKQLQDYLLESEEIDGDQIMPIPVKRTTEKKGKKFSIPKIKRSIDKSSPYRNRFLNMVILNVVLVVILVLFILISNNSKNLNIINYRNRIDAEYTEKEDNLARLEKQLQIREEQLSQSDGE